MSQGTPKQRKAFGFLRARRDRPFSAADLAGKTGYTTATAETNLSQHWASVVEREGERWKGRPIVMRMTLGEFMAIAQSKRRTAAHETRTYLLLDASAVAPYYVPQATSSDTLRERIHTLIESVRDGRNRSFLYMPNFAIAETFGVFMKHGFSAWNRQTYNKLTRGQYLDAVERFQNDIHNGQLIYQYELNRYHILGINLVGPVDYHYQMVRPKRQHPAKRRAPKPAGTSDQLIVSMGVQLAHLHGAPNTVVSPPTVAWLT